MILALTLFLAAWADEPAADGDLPPPELPPVVLERIPPRVSWDFAIQPSFGTIPHFYGDRWPWVGLGVRGGGGYHIRGHRLGGALGVSIEGEAPVYYNLAFEPQATWDFIAGHLLVGASVGPSVLVHGAMGLKDTEYKATLAPTAAARIGYSQGWTRVGRRLFVSLEPRVRYARGKLYPTAMVLVGSGSGR